MTEIMPVPRKLRITVLPAGSIVAIFFSLCVLVLTACSYNPPEGFTKEHHTYDEILAFAKSLDEEAVVSEEYQDTIEMAGTIEYCYREWTAVIKGVKCHVTSAPNSVVNDGLFPGEFFKRYYRIDKDYDFCISKQIVAETNSK